MHPRQLTPGPSPARFLRALLVALACAAACVPTVRAASVRGQGTWETTLQGRDLDGNAATFEAFYDTTLGITWLADANLAQTSRYDADGYMSWDVAQTWAASLNVNGVTGWRLATMTDTGAPGCEGLAFSGTDCGFNVSTGASELAHMFFVTLGNRAIVNAARVSQSGGLSNTGPFSNVKANAYWTDVTNAPFRGSAWAFYNNQGYQGPASKELEFSAWAVRTGDVSAVPEPEGVAMALAAVAAGVCVRRRVNSGVRPR